MAAGVPERAIVIMNDDDTSNSPVIIAMLGRISRRIRKISSATDMSVSSTAGSLSDITLRPSSLTLSHCATCHGRLANNVVWLVGCSIGLFPYSSTVVAADSISACDRPVGTSQNRYDTIKAAISAKTTPAIG